MLVPLLALAVVGHIAVWVTLFNRLHAQRFPCRAIRVLEWAIIVATPLVPLLVAVQLLRMNPTDVASLWPTWTGGYLAVCIAYLLLAAPPWIALRCKSTDRDDIQHTRVVRLDAQSAAATYLHGWRVRGWARLPANEILQLEINQKSLRVMQLPEPLDGLSIAHISDLHLTGKMTRRFYEDVVELTNGVAADAIVITGDIIDHPQCLDWLEPVLSPLQAPLGVFYVLGNHDKRIRDAAQIHERLAAAGLIYAGGQWLTREWRGERVLLAGNEEPWFAGPPEAERPTDSFALRLALLHSPDQIEWVQRHDFQVALAGHNHGGQIRLPLIGPIVSPSRYGTRYASGTFREGSTLLHVSRGISAVHPIRFGCRPEITRLVLSRVPTSPAPGTGRRNAALLTTHKAT